MQLQSELCGFCSETQMTFDVRLVEGERQFQQISIRRCKGVESESKIERDRGRTRVGFDMRTWQWTG